MDYQILIVAIAYAAFFITLNGRLLNQVARDELLVRQDVAQKILDYIKNINPEEHHIKIVSKVSKFLEPIDKFEVLRASFNQSLWVGVGMVFSAGMYMLSKSIEMFKFFEEIFMLFSYVFAITLIIQLTQTYSEYKKALNYWRDSL